MPIDLLNIVYSFLENRKGFIYHEKFKSSLFDILAGVPQGSCLSPILFCLFVSDIPKPKNNVKLSQFADDIVAWLVFRSMWNNDLEKYIDELLEWCSSWVLKGKYKTTKHTNMGNCKKEVTINGEKIKNTKLTKFLGIQIDHKLTLNKQKMTTVNQSYYLITFLNELKIKYNTPPKNLIPLYKTLIRSST